MYRKRLTLMILCITLIILSAGGGYILGKGINSKEIYYKDISNKFQGINIRITNTTQIQSTGTIYTLVIKNISPYLIKQNTVYLSYPIKKVENGQIMNKCKVEALGNKIDIKPNEEVTLDVFMPIENYENNNKIDSSHPQYEIEGYLNEVSNLTHFMQSGNLLK